MSTESSSACPVVCAGVVVADHLCTPIDHLPAAGELVAATISNVQTRTEVQRLTDEQAALRRVATMVARESSPEEILATVARGNAMSRMKARIGSAEAENYAGKQLLAGETLEDRFSKLERDEQIERLLEDLKQKQGRMLEAG